MIYLNEYCLGSSFVSFFLFFLGIYVSRNTYLKGMILESRKDATGGG